MKGIRMKGPTPNGPAVVAVEWYGVDPPHQKRCDKSSPHELNALNAGQEGYELAMEGVEPALDALAKRANE